MQAVAYHQVMRRRYNRPKEMDFFKKRFYRQENNLVEIIANNRPNCWKFRQDVVKIDMSDCFANQNNDIAWLGMKLFY